jgi:hypothetical protein
LDSLNVETNGWNGSDNFTQFQLVQNGGLTSTIKTNHKNTHFFVTKKVTEQLRGEQTHF